MGKNILRYLIRVFMSAGAIAVLLGGSAMDSNSVIVPICVICLGLGMVAFGGYIDSYFEWYEERRSE